MEQLSTGYSDKDYLQEITRFAEEYLTYEKDLRILPGVLATRISTELGMGLRLETDELMAIWDAIENKHRLYIPTQESRTSANRR